MFSEIPIQFIVPLKDLTVQESEPCTLEVKVNKPNAVLTWYQNGKEVSADDRVEIIVEGTVHQLNIKSAQLTDEGDYLVTVGVAVSQGHLTVDGKFILE